MGPFIGYMFVVLLLLYLIWRVWVAVKHLDQMPWQFPVLIFFLAEIPVTRLCAACAGRFFPNAGEESVGTVSLVLLLAITAVLVIFLNRAYDRWREREQEKRNREKMRRDPDMAP